MEINYSRQNEMFDGFFKGVEKMDSGKFTAEMNMEDTLADKQKASLSVPFNATVLENLLWLERTYLRVFFWTSISNPAGARVRIGGKYFTFEDDLTYACHPSEFLLIDQQLRAQGLHPVRSDIADWYVWGQGNADVVFLPNLVS